MQENFNGASESVKIICVFCCRAMSRCLNMLANTEAGRVLLDTPCAPSCTAGRATIRGFVPACTAAVAACADESSKNALTDYVVVASRLTAAADERIRLLSVQLTPISH
jgi:hypothetical protein